MRRECRCSQHTGHSGCVLRHSTNVRDFCEEGMPQHQKQSQRGREYPRITDSFRFWTELLRTSSQGSSLIGPAIAHPGAKRTDNDKRTEDRGRNGSPRRRVPSRPAASVSRCGPNPAQKDCLQSSQKRMARSRSPSNAP